MKNIHSYMTTTSQLFLDAFGKLEVLENKYLAKDMGLCNESNNTYVFFDAIHKVYNCYIEALLKHAKIHNSGVVFFQQAPFGGDKICLRTYLSEHGHILDTLPVEFQHIIRNYCAVLRGIYEF